MSVKFATFIMAVRGRAAVPGAPVAKKEMPARVWAHRHFSCISTGERALPGRATFRCYELISSVKPVNLSSLSIYIVLVPVSSPIPENFRCCDGKLINS
jgi:hypothetical protein